MKKLNYNQLLNKNGKRHVTGAVHFTDGDFVTFFNSSVSQILSYINTCGKKFLYFCCR